MSALPVRYVGWMTRDLVRGPGLVMLMVAASAVSVEIVVNGGAVLGAYRVTTVFVLLATAGIVSGDFVGGYHRMLFAKPVSPPLYYLQRWLLGAAAVLLAALLVDVGLAVRLDLPMIGLRLLARAGLLYLLLGSLVFFVSTITRRDWLVAVLLMLGQSSLGAARAAGFWPGPVARAVYAVLPPFHLVGAHRPVPSGTQLAHVVLYGVALLLAALAVLRWRPLGSGRRE